MHSFVLGIDLDGKVVANLQYEGSDAYAPITRRYLDPVSADPRQKTAEHK